MNIAKGKTPGTQRTTSVPLEYTCVPGDIYCRSYSAVPEWAVASRAARKKEQLSILTSR